MGAPDDDTPDYDTFTDFFRDNPQKLNDVVAHLMRQGMRAEDAKREVLAYIASQKDESVPS